MVSVLCALFLFVFKFFTNPGVVKIFFYVLEIFFVWTLSFRSMVHMELIFIHGVKKGSRCIFPCGCTINPLPHPEKTIISPFYCSDTFVI